MKILAKIIASILHPATLVLPAVFIIIFKTNGSIQVSLVWTIISLIFTGIIATFVFLGVKKGFFSDYDVSVKKQRVILYPFVILIVILFTGVIFLFKGPSSLIFSSILFIIALLILDIVNIRIKASVHVASVSSIVVGIAYMYGGLTYFLLLLIPLVAWARIVQKRHTLQETVVGAICGILLTIAAIIGVQFIL